jgi:SNF2 family DNA or RNA helicase
MLQAEDRAHRIGVKYPVNVYYLHAPDSIGETMPGVVQ